MQKTMLSAVGAALLAQRHVRECIERDGSYESSFIGIEAVRKLSYTQQANSICPFCGNACNRNIVTFQDGTYTGIDDINGQGSMANGQAIYKQGSTIVNLAGQRMVNGKCPRGIYIINGKKYIQK